MPLSRDARIHSDFGNFSFAQFNGFIVFLFTRSGLCDELKIARVEDVQKMGKIFPPDELDVVGKIKIKYKNSRDRQSGLLSKYFWTCDTCYNCHKCGEDKCSSILNVYRIDSHSTSIEHHLRFEIDGEAEVVGFGSSWLLIRELDDIFMINLDLGTVRSVGDILEDLSVADLDLQSQSQSNLIADVRWQLQDDNLCVVLSLWPFMGLTEDDERVFFSDTFLRFVICTD